MIKLSFFKRKRSRGQSMVEFALTLPVLLLMIMGIVEFARLMHAFLAVQNAARFAARYASSGEYNSAYCNSTYISEATPPTAGTYCDNDVEQDLARLYSIRDAAAAGAAGIAANHAAAGSPIATGTSTGSMSNRYTNKNQVNFFYTTICSTRDANSDAIADYLLHTPPGEDEDCTRFSDGAQLEDAGGPGDRVIVMVRYNHQLITPFVSQLWQQLPLRAQRQAIVEKFRIAAVEGVAPAFVTPSHTYTPSNTPTKTYTPTNTNTPTNTFTPSNTPTNTSTASKTFTPTNTATRTNTATSTLTNTPTTTATPYCGGLVTDPAYTEPVFFRGSNNDNIDIRLKSNYAIGDITVTGMTVFWNGVWNYSLYSGGSFVQQAMPAVSLDYYRWTSSGGSNTDYNPSNVALPTNGTSFTRTVTFTTQPALTPGDTALLTLDFTQSFTASSYRHLHHAVDWTMTVNYTAGGLSCSANFTGLDGPALTVSNPPTGTISGTFPNVQATGADANGISQIKFEVYDASTGTIVGSRSDSSSPYCFTSSCAGITINGTNSWPGGSVIVDGTYYMLVEARDNDPHRQYTIQRFDFTISGAPTLTPSRTPTFTRTPTASLTPSRTYTPTISPTPSRTFTPSNTPTRTNTPTITQTASRTNTRTATSSPTVTSTPSKTYTPSNTATRTSTFTRTNTSPPSNTATNTKTFTPTFTRTNTPTRTPTQTPTTGSSATPTHTPTDFGGGGT